MLRKKQSENKLKENKKIRNNLYYIKNRKKLQKIGRINAKKYYKKNKNIIHAKRQKYYTKYPQHKFRIYKISAKNRNLKFTLTKKQFMLYWQQPCYYCGAEILTIGLDRINNNKGYSLNNITPCCPTCNKMKNTTNQKFFIDHCIKIVKRLG